MSDILEIYSRAPKSDEIIKALKDQRLDKVKMNDPKSAIIDPYGAQGSLGLRSKPTPIPFSTLKNMAKVPAIAAIINTRLNQVARFARRPRFEGDMGFKIVLKDKNATMSEAQKKRAFEIEEFFLRTGAVKNARRKDNLDSFLRKIVRDTLTIDALTFENVPNIKGGLAELWAVDAATIELVANAPVGDENELTVYEPVTKRGMRDSGDIAYVQRIDGQIVAEYTEAELCYAIRNPRTDIETVDFGMSELETLIEIVTGIMNSIRYNTTYFSSNHLPQGILEIVGKVKDEHLESFERHWRTMTEGASGKWAVPVLGMSDGQGVKFTPFKTSNRDMEFNEFLEFLFNVACAVYQIDPNEVGFKSWTSSNSMSASDNTAEKMDQSKDKGFIPLMQFLANTFNSEVVDQIDEEYCLTWVGLDEQDEDAKWNRYKMQIDSGVVPVAEVRKKEDMEEILDDEGKPAAWTQAPGNTVLMQVYMAELQARQQAEQQEQAATQQAQEVENQKSQVDDAHKKNLEVMDKQHEQNVAMKQMDQDHQKNIVAMQHKQNMEGKAADQKHQTSLATMQQKAKDKEAKAKGKPLKKSLAPDSEDFEIEISWKDY